MTYRQRVGTLGFKALAIFLILHFVHFQSRIDCRSSLDDTKFAANQNLRLKLYHVLTELYKHKADTVKPNLLINLTFNHN